MNIKDEIFIIHKWNLIYNLNDYKIKTLWREPIDYAQVFIFLSLFGLIKDKKGIKLSDSVTSISETAFLNVSNITNFEISPNNSKYKVIDGILYSMIYKYTFSNSSC